MLHKPMQHCFFLFLCLFFTACSPQYSGKLPPKVVNGEIDLTGWDFEKDGPVKLDGDWLFAWEKFVEPASWGELQKQMVDIAAVPSQWQDLENPGKPGEKLPVTGYATYAVKVTGLNSSQQMAYLLAGQNQAFEVITLTLGGQILSTQLKGIPSLSKETEVPAYDIHLSFPIVDQEIILLIQESNHYSVAGGQRQPATLGLRNYVRWKINQDFIMQVIMAGVLLIIGLYHLVLFFQRRKDRQTLYFGLFCLAVFFRTFSMGIGHRLLLEESLFTNEWLKRLEYLTIPLMVMLFSAFIYSLFSTRFLKNLTMAFISLGLPLVLLVISTERIVYGKYLSLYHVYVLSASLIAFYLIYLTIKGDRLAMIISFALFIVMTGTINDILYSSNIINTGVLFPYTVLAFILLQAGIISHNSARAHKQAETLAVDLQNEIKEKKELQVSNDELVSRQKKFTRLIEDLSQEYAQAGEQLETAKAEQSQVAKELQEASRQLIQAEKLSGLGAMVSGIAHDINNPLNFIETARFQEQEKLGQLKEHLLGLVPEGREGEEFKADLLARFDKLDKLNDQVKTGVTRVTEISKSMRNASRADTEKTADVNLVEVIEEAMIITGNKVKEFQVINNIHDNIVLASCNRSQIGQVVMNFLSNAADALLEYKAMHKDHKGIIQVDLAINNQNHDRDQNQPKTVQFSVSDNGAGVPLESHDKVLNAFFTTKAAGVGTGLGLAICDKIAQAHDGTIQIEHGLLNGQGGHGAKFTLEFVG